MIWYLLSALLSVGLLFLIHQLGGDRLRQAKERLRTSWIRWVILVAFLALMVYLLVSRET